MIITDLISTLSRKKAPMAPSALQGVNIDSGTASTWAIRAGLYDSYWTWYDGSKLKELNDNGVLKYPLRINPIRWICKKHGRTLFGEVPDSASSLVQFSYQNADGKVDEACKAAARIVNTVWSQSYGAEIQASSAIISQVLGGSVFKLLWRKPSPSLAYGVRILKIIPDYFMPIWDSEDMWDLAEVFLMYCITPEEAEQKYGMGRGTNPNPIYMEHWTRDTFDISIDGKPPKSDLQDWQGDNPFGFVPFVYIPHEDRADGFYGTGHVEGLDGLVEELNWRMADRGDGVRSANQDQTVMKNSSSGIKLRQAGTRLPVMDIGSAPIGTTKDPDMWNLEPSAVKGGSLSRDFIQDLWTYICNASDTPAVAWGEDGGASQRSSMTLETLYMALLGHIRMERIITGIGYGVINKMILRMVNAKLSSKVSDAMLELEPRTRWAKILPRERMDMVNEMALRKPNGLVSTRQAIIQLSEGEDVDEELAEIQKEKDEAAAQQQKIAEYQLALKAKASANAQGEKKANPRQERPTGKQAP